MGRGVNISLTLVVGVAVVFGLCYPDARSQDASCARGDFEAVVDDAAGALRALNKQNKSNFQERLRQLREKKGWSHEEFLVRAEPYVRDEAISVFDNTSARLLGEIATLGQEGSEAPTPDCKLLSQLHERMTVLVTAQTDKWTYMFDKIDKALAE